MHQNSQYIDIKILVNTVNGTKPEMRITLPICMYLCLSAFINDVGCRVRAFLIGIIRVESTVATLLRYVTVSMPVDARRPEGDAYRTVQRCL